MSPTPRIPDDLGQAEEALMRFIGDAAEGAFTELALHSFRIQCARIPAYAAYARHLGRGPDQIRDWREIPAVPASAFRSHDLSAAARDREAVTFETSGTTISLPGRVRLSSTRLYETSLSRSFARHLLPDGVRLHAIVFGPTRAEAKHSSLWFMADRIARERSEGTTWVVDQGQPRWERADEVFARAIHEGRPVLLLGTTLLFQAYFTRCDREGLRFPLPVGSRAMDTGGAKGTRVSVDRGEIQSGFARVLGIPPTHIVNEYGMAEMGSQFYEDSFLAFHEQRELRPGFTIPPWVRTRVLDPEKMRERPEGTPGLLVHYDLANLEVPIAIQTEDVGAVEGGRLTLAGRLPETERRGCSLPFERFLEAEAR